MHEGICGSLFSYTDFETRVRADHPLRVIRQIVNGALQALSGAFDPLYSPIGRVSIPPEWLMRGLLLQALYSIRSERQLVERLDYDLLFRWFVGLGWRYPSNVARSSAMLNLDFGGGTILGHKWSVRKARARIKAYRFPKGKSGNPAACRSFISPLVSSQNTAGPVPYSPASATVPPAVSGHITSITLIPVSMSRSSRAPAVRCLPASTGAMRSKPIW
jgi:hypothetical protein